MSRLDDLSYYRLRQRQEIAAANAAAHPAARQIHEQLAACYATHAGSIADVEEKPRPGLVAA